MARPIPVALAAWIRRIGDALTLRPMLFGLSILLSIAFAIAMKIIVDTKHQFSAQARSESMARMAQSAVLQKLETEHEPRARRAAEVAATTAIDILDRSGGWSDAAAEEILAHAFEQRLASGDQLDVVQVGLLDDRMNPILESRRPGEPFVEWDALRRELGERTGMEARKIASSYVYDSIGRAVHVLVHPIGVFRLRGYVMMATTPGAALRGVGELLDAPVRIETISGFELVDEEFSDTDDPHLQIVQSDVVSRDGQPLFWVQFKTDERAFEAQVTRLRRQGYLFIALVAIGGLALGGLILNATVFRRVRATSAALGRIVAGDTTIDLPSGGRDELGQMARNLAKVAAFVDDVVRLKSDVESKNAELRQLIADREQAEAKVSYLAEHDELTGLANRSTFQKRARNSIDQAALFQSDCVLMLVNLDLFKQINDAFGHRAGDELLAQVGERFTGFVRDFDMVSRIGVDEFAILLAGAMSDDDCLSLVTRLKDEIAAPFDLSGKTARITASVGVAKASQAGFDLQRLFGHADLALRAAKDAGRGGVRFFERGLLLMHRERAALEAELRRAADEGAFTVLYQPQYAISGAKPELIGVEALLRWRSADLGPVSPEIFIPIAERAGLIGKIGGWVLKRACAEVASLPSPIKLAVNLSPLQMTQAETAEAVREALSDAELDASRLELEITESVLLTENEIVRRNLDVFFELGVEIAMDDFGTGYSSLGYLQKFPFAKIKIDRSFVSGDAKGEGDADISPIITAIVGLGRTMGLRVNAEGVETEHQLEALRALGCDEAQGYFFSPPVDIETIRALCADFAAAPMAKAPTS